MHLALWVMVCFFVGNLGGALIEQSRPPGPAKVVSAPSSVWPLVISVVSFQGVILVLTPLFLRRHDTDSNEAFGFRFSWKHAVLLGVVVAYIYLWIGQLLKYLSVMFMNWISLAAQDQISVQVLHNSPLGDRVVIRHRRCADRGGDFLSRDSLPGDQAKRLSAPRHLEHVARVRRHSLQHGHVSAAHLHGARVDLALRTNRQSHRTHHRPQRLQCAEHGLGFTLGSKNLQMAAAAGLTVP